VFNPCHTPTGGSLARAPIPVKPRPTHHISPQDWGTGWVQDAPRTDAIRNALSQVLIAEGMEVASIWCCHVNCFQLLGRALANMAHQMSTPLINF